MYSIDIGACELIVHVCLKAECIAHFAVPSYVHLNTSVLGIWMCTCTDRLRVHSIVCYTFVQKY